MQAVILAGGMGTRLREITGDTLPKPLVPVNGRPLLDHHLTSLAQSGVSDVVLLTGFGGDQIAVFSGDGSRWGLRVRCIREEQARGTAGAVLDSLDQLDERFLVVYGDTVFDFDAQRMWARHIEARPDATIFLHPNDHPHDSDLVEVDDNDHVLRFHPYPHPPDANLPNLVNAGIYILERNSLRVLANLPPKPDFGKHVFAQMLAQGRLLLGYRSPEYVKDAGTPERLRKTEQDLTSGRVAACSLRHAAPAVLLDRDGTLNELDGYIRRPEQLRLIPGVAKALARLNRSKYRTALVSNQPIIARGECDEAGMRQIHNRLETLLGAEGAYLDAIYYCPHHPDAGFPGERADLKIRCDCRKPAIGMILRALRELNLSLADSWFIGDTTRDILAARRAGLLSILLQTGDAGRDGRYPALPDLECPTLTEAVSLILDRWPRISERTAELARGIAPGSIVVIGGQARAGKSTLSACLARTLQSSGTPATVVPLDCWLLGEDEDRGPSVLHRFNLAAAHSFLADARREPGLKLLPRYDRRTRRAIPAGAELDIAPNAVLIVEGVIALADPALRALASRTIYVERPEQDRLREVADNYRWRGWPEDRINALLADRAAEELPLVAASASFADFIVKDFA
jgi:histidinol-phosphate phosphatase family protein